MSEYINELLELFKEFPGIGQRGAERIIYSLLQWPPEKIEFFGEKLAHLPHKIQKCEICGNITENAVCSICSSFQRDKSTICVVEDFSYILPIEKSGYKGVYHILEGKISPLNNKNIEDLTINKLLERIEQSNVKEVILALSQDIEGQATSIYIANLLKDKNITVTTLARGIPAGADISFANSATISVAFNGRTPLQPTHLPTAST
jgi:recombination protein RecR